MSFAIERSTDWLGLLGVLGLAFLVERVPAQVAAEAPVIVMSCEPGELRDPIVLPQPELRQGLADAIARNPTFPFDDGIYLTIDRSAATPVSPAL